MERQVKKSMSWLCLVKPCVRLHVRERFHYRACLSEEGGLRHCLS